MAYTGTIVTVAEMQFFAGENVDATGDVEANHNYLAGHAEAELCLLVKYDIVTNWATINSTYKKIFSEYAGRLAGIGLIQYNMHGYGDTNSTARIHAEDQININWARLKILRELLIKADVQDFLGV